jgi:UDP-N-acetylmuramate--alanine ligase
MLSENSFSFKQICVIVLLNMNPKDMVHFIGIGGIGVSALAKYYLSRGAQVSGSDLVSTEITEELQSLGTEIFIGPHRAVNLPKTATLVVHTSAVPPKNIELAAARKRKLPVKSYPEAVGELTRDRETITISGSHGKSTTTALASLVLESGYFDPTVIAGTKIKEFGNSNFHRGYGPHLVLEADEWNKSFLNYFPNIAIVTNIDTEHVDTYRKAGEIEKVFEEYLSRVPGDGIIIANRDDARLYGVAKKFSAQGGSASLGRPSTGKAGGKNRVVWYSLGNDHDVAAVRQALKIPGLHNISNALAALTLGRVLGIPQPAILHALSRFSGAWRRFDFRGTLNGASIFDDYGHHPREINSTILAARSRFPMRRIWCVYQPHQYQRLSYLWEDFTSAFDMADRICLLPVYDVAGRGTKTAKTMVNSEKLAQALIERGKNACHLNNFLDAQKFINKEVRPGDIVLMMGAGDIYNLSGQLFST